MILYQLSRTIAYLSIKDKSKNKVIIDWYIPIVLSSLITVLYYFLPEKIALVGTKGLISSISGFLQIMPGFYLAALAAISTFQKVDLDYRLPNPSPSIIIKERGENVEIELTRRGLLNYLFCYLTFISLALYIVIIFIDSFAENYALISEVYLIGLRGIFLFSFFFFFFQMIFITFWGLY